MKTVSDMIRKASIVAVFGLSIATLNGFAQAKCKVLVKEIAGSYEGKCKKGLASGKGVAVGTDRYEGRFSEGLPQGEGTYTWSNGDSYTGDWFMGKRHGEGVMTLHNNGKDSIQAGIWQKDMYIGPKPPKPMVLYQTSVDRYTFQKNMSFKSRVLMDFNQNGMRNKGITNFLMSSSSGYETKLGESIGYDEVTFPVTIKVSYTTPNKLNTMPVSVKFEFMISEPGDWVVTLTN